MTPLTVVLPSPLKLSGRPLSVMLPESVRVPLSEPMPATASTLNGWDMASAPKSLKARVPPMSVKGPL